MENIKKTDIAELGKFGLVDRLADKVEPVLPSTIKGFGDDAAVVCYEKEQNTVVATDF